MSRRKIGAKERIALSKEYLRGETSREKIAKKYGIGISTARDIIAVYEAEGEEKCFIWHRLILQENGQADAETGEKSIPNLRFSSPTDCLNSRNPGSCKG